MEEKIIKIEGKIKKGYVLGSPIIPEWMNEFEDDGTVKTESGIIVPGKSKQDIIADKLKKMTDHPYRFKIHNSNANNVDVKEGDVVAVTADAFYSREDNNYITEMFLYKGEKYELIPEGQIVFVY